MDFVEKTLFILQDMPGVMMESGGINHVYASKMP